MQLQTRRLKRIQQRCDPKSTGGEQAEVPGQGQELFPDWEQSHQHRQEWSRHFEGVTSPWAPDTHPGAGAAPWSLLGTPGGHLRPHWGSSAPDQALGTCEPQGQVHSQGPRAPCSWYTHTQDLRLARKHLLKMILVQTSLTHFLQPKYAQRSISLTDSERWDVYEDRTWTLIKAEDKQIYFSAVTMYITIYLLLYLLYYMLYTLQ